MKMFIDNLIEKVKSKKSHAIVGLDPTIESMPKFLIDMIKEPSDVSESIFQFNRDIIDSVHDLVPAVKPQIAFYERYGLAGIEAFVKTVDYGKQKGLIVIEDAKRNDIGSTANAYSDGHIGKVKILDKEIPTFDVDAMTINPYLGSDGIFPFIEDVNKYNKGVFVLVKTSNKTSIEIQDVEVISTDGKTSKLYEHVARLVDKWGEGSKGYHGFSSVGAVVGATFPKDAEVLRTLMPNTYFLVPGYGAQGGSAKDVLPSFNRDGLGALIAASRSIIYAYQNITKYSEKEYANAARDAVKKMNNDINQTLSSNGLLEWN